MSETNEDLLIVLRRWSNFQTVERGEKILFADKVKPLLASFLASFEAQRTTIDELEQKLKGSAFDLQNLKGIASRLESENRQLLAQFQERGPELQRLSQQVKSQEAELRDMRKDFANETNTNRQLRAQLEAARSEIERIKNIIVRASAAIHQGLVTL